MSAGLYWHVHHDTLYEWCYDVDERTRYIRESKPPEEVETRLRLMQPVRDAPAQLGEARRAYDEARRAYDEAGRAYGEARRAYVEAGRAYGEARRAYGEARRAYGEARLALEAEMVRLHSEQCLGCPWDGRTIFPKGGA